MTSKKRVLNKVYMSSDTFAACVHHCLTTEKEEVVGLLVGELDEDTCTIRILASVVMHRSDKKPDRVEIPPEQLCIGSTYAEKLSKDLHKTIRVIGWYHSHPHITVWPSAVDVRTQSMYQVMDSLFVGLIFAVYQSDHSTTANVTQVICFQSELNGSDLKKREVELEIENSALNSYNLKGMVKLPVVLAEEDDRSNFNEGTHDPITYIHNDAFQTLAFAHIVVKVALPILEGLEARLQSTKARIKELERIKRELTN